MKIIKKLVRTIYRFIGRICEDNVGVYSAQASFFLILSIFPLIMLILTIVGMTDLPQDLLSSAGNQFLPGTIEPLFQQILKEMTNRSSGTVLSVSALTAAWSASKGILSIQRGLQSVHHIKSNRNYFIQRFISLFYTIILVVIVVLTLAILVFGNQLYHLTGEKSPVLYNILGLIFQNRALIFLCILTLFFLMLYATTHTHGFTLGDLFPGALFSASGWMLFSYIFSIYIDNFNNLSYMYGSLTTVVILMLWLYFCMYIVFIGAEFNVFVKQYNRRTFPFHKPQATEPAKQEGTEADTTPEPQPTQIQGEIPNKKEKDL